MISKIEQKLYDELKLYYPELKQQLCLSSDSHRYYYDISMRNKIIEFNGDLWHANPNIYEFDDYIRTVNGVPTSAYEIWAYDSKKMQLAKDMGYKIFIVWESEYKKFPKGTLRKCLEFLYE